MVVVGGCRLSSSSVVVIVIVGGRGRWSLLSLPLLLLLPWSLVGRRWSSWSAMVMTAIIMLRVMRVINTFEKLNLHTSRGDTAAEQY